MESTRKAFDSTVCFTFFGSWVEAIEEVNNYMGEPAAFCLYSAIADYSMYGIEPDFSQYPFLKAVWRTVEREIDLSLDNRKRGFAKDTSNEKYQAIIDAVIENPGASLRAIGEMTGTNKNMVDLVKRKFRAEIEAAIAAKYGASVDAVDSIKDSVSVPVSDDNTVNDCVNDNDSVIDNVNDNDSKGQDKTGQTGQTQDRDLSVLDNIIVDNNSSDAMRVRGKWNNLYTAWRQSIETEDVQAILDRYLSEHEESPALKKMGDKYGRIIDGWNEEQAAPNIVYSHTYFPDRVKHNLTGIPVNYYRTENEELSIEEERQALRDYYAENGVDMSAYEVDEDGEMPF